MARMQIITRNAVPLRRGRDYSRPAPTGPLPRGAVAFVFIEADPSAIGELDDAIVGVRHSFSTTGGLSIDIDPTPIPMNDEWIDERPYRYDHVHGAITSLAIERSGFDVLLGIGKLHLRRSAMPVADGMIGLVGAGLIINSNGFEDGVLYECAGGSVARMTETDRRTVPGAFRPGDAPGRVHTLPIWGFGAEPRAFGATFLLEDAERMDRYNDLLAITELTAREEAEIEELETDEAVRDVLLSSRTDERYASFLEAYRATDAYGERVRMLDCPTADDLERAAHGHARVMADWMEAKTVPLYRI